MSNSAAASAPSGAPIDVTTPAKDAVPMKHHSMPGDHLLRQTRLDLVSAGIPESALGTFEGRTLKLGPCIVLTDAALDSLPPALGGGTESFKPTARTADMLARALPLTPTGRYSPAPPRTLFGGAAGGDSSAPAHPLPGVPTTPPSGRERREAHLAAGEPGGGPKPVCDSPASRSRIEAGQKPVGSICAQ
jgi:hypothetical protein